MRNLLCRVPKSAQPFVATMGAHHLRPALRGGGAQAQLKRVIEQLAGRFPEVVRLLEEAAPDVTAFAAFTVEHWRQIWSNNPQERLNREVRRQR